MNYRRPEVLSYLDTPFAVNYPPLKAMELAYIRPFWEKRWDSYQAWIGLHSFLRARRVAHLHVNGLTFKQIARIYNLSAGRIEQIEKSYFRKLKHPRIIRLRNR